MHRDQQSTIWVQFKFERLSDLCYRCGHIGHNESSCSVAALRCSEGVLDPRCAYRPWLRANASPLLGPIRDRTLAVTPDPSSPTRDIVPTANPDNPTATLPLATHLEDTLLETPQPTAPLDSGVSAPHADYTHTEHPICPLTMPIHPLITLPTSSDPQPCTRMATHPGLDMIPLLQAPPLAHTSSTSFSKRSNPFLEAS